jgi:uncharacterized membrane protein
LVRLLRLLVAIAVVIFVVTLYKVVRGTVVTGSGGLGAVSGGFMEALVEVTAMIAVVGIYFYLRRLRRARERGARRP